MNASAKEQVWFLLSDLFVDTEWSERELRGIGVALRDTGFSSKDVEKILRAEVAPVCGRWMRYPSIGPWPMFDREWVRLNIQKYLERPWYIMPFFGGGLWGLGSVKRDWTIVRAAMEQ